jgi:hypothetical protein
MAVQRRVNWLSQQRVDVPDMRSVESAVSNDFDQLIQGFVTGTAQGYFVRGFNILMAGAIGGAASGLQLNVDPGAVLHIAASQSGTVLMVPTGTLPQALNSATNTNVTGAFAPSAVNYVTIDYLRFIDPATSAQVYVWNPTTNNETTKNAPRAQILEYQINISTATPTSNLLPIATVITDANNNVVDIQDDRPLIGRLGRGGINPNPFYQYPWSQGRTENPSSSTSNSVDPFSGGDKVIDNLKSWMDAVMTSIQEIKGTTYWYSQSSSGSLETLREDLANTVITGKGSIAHGVLPSDKKTPTQAGQINWDQDINIRVIGSELTYSLTANPTSTDITLADDQVAYITLIRGQIITPNLVFTNGIPQVSSVGGVSWTGDVVAGDYIKLGADTDAGYYEIQSVDSLTQVTLTTNFGGTSTGPSGAKAEYAFGSYSTSPTPSTNRNIYITTRELVPSGQDVFWLFMRTDNGGAQPRVYIRFLGSELDMGEDRDISDSISQENLIYIGAATAGSYAPQYVSALTPSSVPEVQMITVGAASTIASNEYFFINSSGNSREYYVWFNKDGTGVDPTPPSTNASIQVAITTGQTAAQVAAALASAMNMTYAEDFQAVQQPNPNTNEVEVTNTSAGTTAAGSNFNVGAPFAITQLQAGTGVGNVVINDGDSLTLAIKKLDEAIGNIIAGASVPDYDEAVDIVASGATPPTSLNGPVTAGTDITLPNNTRFGNLAQHYTVGKGTLEVFLNGVYQRLSIDWFEVGVSGAQSTQITMSTNLQIHDSLEFRINTGGGGGAGGGGGTQGPPGPAGPQGPAGADAAGGPISISTKTANYGVLTSDCFLRANCVSTSVTFALPAAASVTGRIFYFKKIDNTTNGMVIQANGSELIDGANSQMTITQYETFSIISNGTSWDIF